MGHVITDYQRGLKADQSRWAQWSDCQVQQIELSFRGFVNYLRNPSPICMRNVNHGDNWQGKILSVVGRTFNRKQTNKSKYYSQQMTGKCQHFKQSAEIGIKNRQRVVHAKQSSTRCCVTHTEFVKEDSPFWELDLSWVLHELPKRGRYLLHGRDRSQPSLNDYDEETSASMKGTIRPNTVTDIQFRKCYLPASKMYRHTGLCVSPSAQNLSKWIYWRICL